MGKRIYLNSTLAYCASCGKNELARIVADGEGVFLERICDNTGVMRAKVAGDHKWYMDRIGTPPEACEANVAEGFAEGCPRDCGPCEMHSARIKLPVFSITNDCNLDCPICFTFNRRDRKYYKSAADTRKIIDKVLERTGSLEVINITGGEPTLHPELFDVLEACRRSGIGKVTMNTNGLKIADDPRFAEKLKAAGVQLVLSLDTFDPDKSRIIHGADITGRKKRALEVIEELDIPVTILPVCIKGVNEDDVSEIVHGYIGRGFVKSFTIQNMTYTGRNGSGFMPREHITIDEVEDLLAKKGVFSRDDFFPLGSYHPLCYSVAYYFVHVADIISLTRFVDKSVLTESSRDSYILDAGADLPVHFSEGINRLWAEGADDSLIRALKGFVRELYPDSGGVSVSHRKKAAEKMIKAVYIHPHMDEDNFDIDRVSRCGDIVPDESGRMIPACSYNLIHRRKDLRFWSE